MNYNYKYIREIHKILNRIKISPEVFRKALETGDSRALGKLLLPLENCLRNQAPKKLFRIRSVTENNIEAFENNSIYLSSADRFNDPFDCLLFFDEEGLRKRIRSQLTKENMINFLESVYDFTSGTSCNFEINEELFSGYEVEKELFLDKTQAKFQMITETLKKSTFISAFTSVINSPIMWSHYGDNHKGFALEYSFDNNIFMPSRYNVINVDYLWYGWRSLLPVIYTEKRADATDLAEWLSFCDAISNAYKFDGKLHDLCGTLPDFLLKTKLSLKKAKEWHYEREWRLILTVEWPNEVNDESASFEIEPTAVFLGNAMSTEDRNRIISVAKNKSITIYEMFIDHSSYEYIMNYKEVVV